MLSRLTAHFLARLQTTAKCWAFWLAKNRAFKIFQKLHATHTSGFTLRHTRNRAIDAWRDAASTAALPTIHNLSTQNQSYSRQFLNLAWQAQLALGYLLRQAQFAGLALILAN